MSDHPPTSLRTCYRHPNQTAGVVCQRCDRPICPRCMNTASVGFHCPECVKSGKQKVYRGVAALQQRPIVTQVLIGINLAVFLIGLVTSSGNAATGLAGRFERDGALFGPLVPTEPWRLVTSGFLHAGFIHVGLNMYALYVLGRVLEPALGRLRYALVYGSSLLAGSLGVILLNPEEVTVGASGAIFGLLGALLVVAHRRRADALVKNLLFILGLNLVFTFSIPNISIGGHIGGAIGGALCGLVLLESERPNVPKFAGAAGVVGLGVVFAAAAFFLMQSKYGNLIVG